MVQKTKLAEDYKEKLMMASHHLDNDSSLDNTEADPLIRH